MAARKARLAALQGYATVAHALDQMDPAATEKVAEEARHAFVAAATRHEEDLAESRRRPLFKSVRLACGAVQPKAPDAGRVVSGAVRGSRLRSVGFGRLECGLIDKVPRRCANTPGRGSRRIGPDASAS